MTGRVPRAGTAAEEQPAVPAQPDGEEPDEQLRAVDVEETFERTVAEGRRRLSRPWSPLIATGLVGGTDVARARGLNAVEAIQ